MNLLNQGQNNDLQEKILSSLDDIGIKGENRAIAQQFFDFSQPIDLSLLEGVTYRETQSSSNTNWAPSIRLFGEMQKFSREKSYDCTDRYILFLDAAFGNGLFRFLFYSGYFTGQDTDELRRVHHAFERRYGIPAVQYRMLALTAYGMNARKLPFSDSMVTAAQRSPRDLYEAGRYCREQNSLAKTSLYALALAYSGIGDFTAEEQDEMCRCLLQKEKETGAQYTDELENLVIMLFLAKDHSTAIQERLQARLAYDFDRIINGMVRWVPTDYFAAHIQTLMVAADRSVQAKRVTVPKLIKRGLHCAVGSDAFLTPSPGNRTQAVNSLCLLGQLAKAYPQEYVTLMTSTDPVGVSDRYGYCFDFYSDLYRLLQEYAPDAIEQYHLSPEQDLMKALIHREMLNFRGQISQKVQDYSQGDTAQEAMNFQQESLRAIRDYLSGEADLTVLEPLRSTLQNSTTDYKRFHHDDMMMKTLSVYPALFDRFVAYKALPHKGSLRYFLVDSLRGKTPQDTEVRRIFGAMLRQNVPLADRVEVFEMVCENIAYWDAALELVKDTAVSLMAENADRQDAAYAAAYVNWSPLTRCCYARYLDRTNTNDKNKERLLALCGDGSKEVRRMAIVLLGQYKHYEPDVTALLSAKKQSVRETAVDIFALWGVEHYRAILEKAADSEKSIKLADKIRNLLSTSSAVTVSENGGAAVSPLSIVEDLHKGGRNRKLSWLYTVPLPIVHFNNGQPADEKYLQALILCYSTMPTVGRNDQAFILAAELNEDELHRYAAEIFSRWYAAGAESKTKWALYYAVIHGGDVMIEEALRCVKDWAENMRGAMAAEAVRAMALNGSSFALMTVDHLAHKFKHKQVRNAALEAMTGAAEALGITADELGDRIVPDLGFDEQRQRIFDYGSRRFKVYLSPTLTLEIFDENDKPLKTLPAPGKKDDETLAQASHADFKALKKNLKTVVAMQKVRLETALLADRRWSKTAWETLFVKNPVMHSFAIGLIWAAYGEEGVQTFRYMEDGTFNTVDEDEYILPEQVRIGLVHPIELDADTISAWQEQLGDYEITQPFAQLDRPLYAVNEEEKGQLDLTRYHGRTINALTLMGRATKLGWSKGSAQDGGVFYVFYREDVTERQKSDNGTVTLLGNAAELHFSGTYIAVENDDVTIENLRFYRPGAIRHGSYVYEEADDQKALPLETIPPRYFSEIILQLEQILGDSNDHS